MSYNKAYYEANRERMLELHKKYRERDPEKRKEYLRKHRSTPEAKAKRAAYEAARRFKKLSATPSWLTDEDKQNIMQIYAYAASLGYHVDHIVPLKNPEVCGLHVPWNLQALPPIDNMKKKNSFLGD